MSKVSKPKEAHRMPSPTAYHVPLAELEAMPTLSQGQADDLKIDTGDQRVWLSRMTAEDGEPYDNRVTIERFVDGSWVEVEYFQAV
jgi:hypothetical protein